MGIARPLGIIEHIQFWPGYPVTHFKFDPPLVTTNSAGEVVAEHEYGIAYVQPEFGSTLNEEAILIAADETGRPIGRSATPIGKVMQASWKPDFDALMFVQGYTIEGAL
jgi:hypothetical protein